MKDERFNEQELIVLFEKIIAAKNAGNEVMLIWDNYSVEVCVAIGKFEEKQKWDETFEMREALRSKKEEYAKCLEYLDRLIEAKKESEEEK